jgi:hypothetical protein
MKSYSESMKRFLPLDNRVMTPERVILFHTCHLPDTDSLNKVSFGLHWTLMLQDDHR